MPETTDPQKPLSNAKAAPFRKRVLVITITSLAALATLSAGAWWGAGTMFPVSRANPVNATSTTVPVPAASPSVQKHLDGLVARGFPSALASVTHPNGDHDDYVSGGTAKGVAPDKALALDGEVRIGSNTKTFTAVVVLQLVQEGLVKLDSPIDAYLPGLVRGEGIDGAAISVRQLLQHTSGLPEYTTDLAVDLQKIQHSYMSPRELIDLAFAQPAHFEPGERWEYSNTNYILLGLLIEKMSKRPIFEAIASRIVEPLGLQHTYFPTIGEQSFRGDHPTGFHVDAAGKQIDATRLDPSWAWAAGQVIASPSDLNEFSRAVLDGRLLGKEMLAEMQKTVPTEDVLWPGTEYGLGLQSYPLSCGGVIWGHGGDIHGFQTRNGVAADGSAFTVAVTSLPWGFIDMQDEDQLMRAYRSVLDAVDANFCQK